MTPDMQMQGIHTLIEPMANMQWQVVSKRLNFQRFFMFYRDTLASRSMRKNELLLCWALVARCQVVFIGQFKAQAGHLTAKEVEISDEAEEQEK